MKRTLWLALYAVFGMIVAKTAVADPTVVADWTFETNLPSNFAGSAGFTGTDPGPGFPVAPEIGSGFATGLHASSSTLWSGPSGNGSAKSLNANNWAIGDYYQFQVSTVGAPNVALSWDETSSNTGPRDFNLQYSTNGTTFTTFGSAFSVLANNTPNPAWNPTTSSPIYNFTVDLSSVTALNNQPAVYFRIVDNSTVSANGGAIGTAGTTRIDNFAVTIGNVAAVSTFWDTNGSAAGLGSTGVWDSGNTKNWNDSTGTGTPAAFDSASNAVFGGTAGTVTISNSSPGVVTAGGGLQFDTTGYTITGDTLNLGTISKIKVSNAADSATIASKISGTSGLTKTGDGTLVLSSTASDFSGNIALNGGTLAISSDANLGATTNSIVFGSGTLKSTFTGDLQLNAARGISGAAGAIDVAAGNTVTAQGTVNTTGALSLPNAGTVALTSGNSTLGGVTFSKNGTLKVGNGGGGSLTLNGNITSDNINTGVATINGNVTFGGTANRTISIQSPTAKVAITGGVTTNFATTGHLVVNGAGTLDIQGDNSGLINAMQIGTQNAAGPTIIVHDAGSLGSVITGQITTFFNSGTIANQKGIPITFAGSLLSSIGGAGSFPSTYAGSNMEFQGAINLFRPTGTTTNHITVNNNTTFSGGWTTTGDAGTLTNNTGVVFDGTGSATLSTASGGSFAAMLAPLTVDGTTVNFNGVNPNNDGATVTIGTNSYTATMQLTAKNNGRLNLSSDNAFAGSGATPAPAKLSLSAGGILGTGGTHQTFNTLTLTSGGTIDLGAGASIVQFNDSHSQAWSGILRISNWSGSATGNGTDQLLVGTSNLTGLTSAQLAEIHFTGLPTGAKLVANGANGEVVPLSTTPLLLGDINGDGHVNPTDITAMLTALTDLNAYKAAHPTLDSATLTDISDVNTDGAFNNLDLQGLIAYLKGGHGSLSAVPEPASFILLALALPALVTVARRRASK